MTVTAYGKPSPLTARGVVDVIAPSHLVNRDKIRAGVERISTRYQLRIPETLFRQKWFLAGSDSERLAELRTTLSGDGHAILSARGGYGAARLVPELTPEEIRDANKLLIGFSDTTVLHALWARAGLQSVHGPMLTTLSHASAETLTSFFGVVEGRLPQPFRGLVPWSPGVATGPLVGGNLSVLASLVGTGFEPPLDGAVLFLEEVGEASYRVHRLLNQLAQAHWFERVAGVALGWFVPIKEVVPLEPVLRDFFGALEIPVVARVPAGHAEPNLSLPFGARVKLDADSGALTFLA